MDHALSFVREFWEKLPSYWADIKAAPELLWKWTEGNLPFRVLGIVVVALLAFLVLYIIVGFFRADWKGKIRTVLIAAVGAVLICCCIWLVQQEVKRYLLPDQKMIELNGEEAAVYPQYSLVRGTLSEGWVDGHWYFADDVFTLQVNDSLVLQLTGLDKLCSEGRYYVNGVSRDNGNLKISLTRNYSVSPDADHIDQIYSDLEIRIIPEQKLEAVPWLKKPGEATSADAFINPYLTSEVTTLENNGKEAYFLARTPYGRDIIGMAIQNGQNMICCFSSGYYFRFNNKNDWSGNSQTVYPTNLNPFDDTEDRTFLAEPFHALSTGCIHCFHDLTEEETGAILPSRIINQAVGNSTASTDGDFSFPCQNLVEFHGDITDWSEDDDITDTLYTLCFTGDGPNSKQFLYTLVNGAGIAAFSLEGTDYEAVYRWGEAYKNGHSQPDEAMTEFLGAPAVAYEEGWILHPGSWDYDSKLKENYYYLTMTVLNTDAG